LGSLCDETNFCQDTQGGNRRLLDEDDEYIDGEDEEAEYPVETEAVGEQSL
jgi:hypothetical protein